MKQEVRETRYSDEIKEIFYNVLDTADVASLSESDRVRYEAYLKFYRDTMHERRDAIAEGKAEGRAEGRAEAMLDAARSLKTEGSPNDFISRVTGLSVEEIEKL